MTTLWLHFSLLILIPFFGFLFMKGDFVRLGIHTDHQTPFINEVGYMRVYLAFGLPAAEEEKEVSSSPPPHSPWSMHCPRCLPSHF